MISVRPGHLLKATRSRLKANCRKSHKAADFTPTAGDLSNYPGYLLPASAKCQTSSQPQPVPLSVRKFNAQANDVGHRGAVHLLRPAIRPSVSVVPKAWKTLRTCRISATPTSPLTMVFPPLIGLTAARRGAGRNDSVLPASWSLKS